MTKTAVSEKARADALKPFRVGDVVEGKVVGIGRSAVFLDLGPQGTGIIYGREFLEEKGALKDVEIEESIVAKILDLENEEGYIELSLKDARREVTWEKLKESKEKESIIEVKVVGANKGGLLAEVYGIQAFLPVSQLSQEHYPRIEDGDTSKILPALQKFMGKELEVQIFGLDPREGKIILSERSKERSKIREILANYKVGDVVEGEITGVVDFGAFVKFPFFARQSGAAEGKPAEDSKKIDQESQQVEGLIHISEIDWQIIDDPSQFLKVGDRVKAKIVDLAQGRASLSLKALREDPWTEVEKKYKKFDEIQGKVTKLNPFGAFVEVEPQIQGLCHISEFGTKKNMEEQLAVGSAYAFQVLEVNSAEHRMSLRLATPSASGRPVQPDDTAGAAATASETESQQTIPQPEQEL